jgi:PKD repeat protein
MKKILSFFAFSAFVLSLSAQKPLATFTVPPGKMVAPAEVTFTSEAKKPVDSYQWDFGDGRHLYGGQSGTPLHTIGQPPGVAHNQKRF